MMRSTILLCLGLLFHVYVSGTNACDATAILGCVVAYETAATANPENAELCNAVHEMHVCSIPHLKACGFKARIDRYRQPFGCRQCDHDFDLYFIVDMSTIATPTQFTDWIDFMKAVTGKLDLVKNKVGVITFSGGVVRHTVAIGDYTDLSDLNAKIDALSSARTGHSKSNLVRTLRFFDANTAEYHCPAMGFVLTWNGQGSRIALHLASRRVKYHMNKRLFNFVQLDFKPGNRANRAYLQKIATPGLQYTLFDHAGPYKKPIDTATDVVTALNLEAKEAKLGIRHNPANPHIFP